TFNAYPVEDTEMQAMRETGIDDNVQNTTEEISEIGASEVVQTASKSTFDFHDYKSKFQNIVKQEEGIHASKVVEEENGYLRNLL
ncbi:TPA: hypothetical protein NR368_000604, partial [Legionella pneumophila]|nr:hypothetical protein [Legionella pneumophila]